MTNDLLPDEIYVRRTTKKGLSAVRPESPLADRTVPNQASRLNRTKYIRGDLVSTPNKPAEVDGDTSDGYHTFNELYEHRHALFAALLRCYPTEAWKSKKHDDGSMFDGWFIAGIHTPEGNATYHIPMRLWDTFEAHEVDTAPKWDGHTPADVITRIGHLATGKGGGDQTDAELAAHDLMVYGVSFMKDGKRVDPNDAYKQPAAPTQIDAGELPCGGDPHRNGCEQCEPEHGCRPSRLERAILHCAQKKNAARKSALGSGMLPEKCRVDVDCLAVVIEAARAHLKQIAGGVMDLSELSQDEQDELKQTPDWLLRYFAPMACGWRERAELCRRKNEEFIARKG